MRLWLVRHAQPLVESGVCYGVLDVAADAAATWQAARSLAQALPGGAPVISSPLQRCELLAQVLQGIRPDLAYKTDQRLVEMNFGCFEGQRWDGMARQALDDWTVDFWQHRFGGVQSVAEFMAQVSSAWDEARLAAQDQVWMTHAGVIRAVQLLARGVRQVQHATQWPLEAPAFGQWYTLNVEPDTLLMTDLEGCVSM
jgi:alpha-ribazole phosphatase